MSEPGLRLDKWLWFARFFKTRSLANRYCAHARVRVNGSIVDKPHHLLRVGDVLTFPLGPRIRVIRVLTLGERRGPAPEARLLYDDLAPTVRTDEPSLDTAGQPVHAGGADG